MTLLVKDEKTDINEVYLMTIKFSSNSYQYKGVKRANRYSTKGFIMGEEEFHEKGRGGGYSGSWGGGGPIEIGGLQTSVLYYHPGSNMY